MQIRRKTAFFALSLIPAFFLYACGGGGGGSSPPPPTTTTTAATSISLHTATLNGTVNPHAQATNAFFEWGTDNALVTPSLTPAQAIGAGSADNSVSAPITGLALGTTYYYRVAATNAAGTNKGAIASFTTALPNSPPSVTTNAATSITLSGAVLNGTVSPNELDTSAVFEWGTDPALAVPTLTTSQPLGAGTTSVAITAPLTGLTPGVTVYFRVAATNSAGTTRGAIANFTPTALAPTVSTGAATSITNTGATFNGTVNPNGLAVTDAHFEYGTDLNLATFTSTSAQPLAAGFTGQALTAPLTGLTPGVTYYFRVAGTNSAGTSKGSIVSFVTTAQAPTVATAAATSITPSGATLNGTVNPNGLAVTDAHFEYGTDSNLATFSTTSLQTLAAGFADQPITASLSDLLPETTYYFRVAATNSAGTSKGLIVSFPTPQFPSPTANAGPDQAVFMEGPMGPGVGDRGPTVVTLDGSGSSGQGGGTIATYEWTQIAGTSSVVLSDNSSATPTFLAPAVPITSNDNLVFQLKVTDNRGLSGTDNVQVTVKWGYLDDFSTDSTGQYSVSTTGTGGTFTFDPVGKRGSVQTGVSNTLTFFKTVPPSNSAVFSMDFSPTTESGSGGNISIYLMDDPDTYYIFSTEEAAVRKVRGTVTVDNVAFPNTYSQLGGPYPIKISFSGGITTVEAFGGSVDLTANDQSNPVNSIKVVTTQQNAYYDNIKLEAPAGP